VTQAGAGGFLPGVPLGCCLGIGGPGALRTTAEQGNAHCSPGYSDDDSLNLLHWPINLLTNGDESSWANSRCIVEIALHRSC
jgi:hypothetical protein